MPETTNGKNLRLKRRQASVPVEHIENPVKRYLRDRWIGHGLGQRRHPINSGWRTLRLAI